MAECKIKSAYETGTKNGEIIQGKVAIVQVEHKIFWDLCKKTNL